jgi:hypothetical protein
MGITNSKFSTGFTWVEWRWPIKRASIEICIEESFEWITDMWTFLSIKSNKKWELNWKFTKTKELFRKIDDLTKEIYTNPIDPIKYIYFLYYKEWFSIKVIANRFNYDKKNLNDFLRFTLWWDLEDANYRTESWKKRREKTNNTSWLESNRNKIHEEALEIYNKKLISILEEIKISDKNKFDKKYLKKLNWKHRKIIYLISIHFKLTIKNSIKLIEDLKTVSGSRVISREFNKEIDNILLKNNIEKIEISESNIEEINKKYDYKKYKEEEFLENSIDESKIEKKEEKFRLKYDLFRIKWVCCRKDLEELQRNTPESSKKVLNNRLNMLEQIVNTMYKNNNHIDPIHYLIYIYYEEWFSMWALSKHLKELWINWSRSTLENNKKLFWWSTNNKKDL